MLSSNAGSRPLPSPPRPLIGARPGPYSVPHTDIHPYDTQETYEPTSNIPAGTFLHKGFYDLLAMIPPSRLIWGTPPSNPVIAGPRYEDITPNSPPVAISARKGRRISKDMVSKPTGFVYVFSTTYIRSSWVVHRLIPCLSVLFGLQAPHSCV